MEEIVKYSKLNRKVKISTYLNYEIIAITKQKLDDIKIIEPIRKYI